MKIAIIGGGNMGTAICRALKENFEALSSLCVAEKNLEKHEKFAELEVDVTDSNVSACEHADLVILAIKPQNFESVDIAGKLKGDAIVVSIMAGVSLAKISDVLGGHEFLVRVMPNLPALISEGISGFYAPNLDDSQKELVHAVLESFGEALEVESEDDIDKVTALSGSGPAYVFYFIESLRDAGVELGLSEDISEKLAIKTVLGSAKYAALDFDSLEELRSRVTSKGGTTEKGLQVLQECGFKGFIAEAAKAAYERAKELGG